MALDHLLMFLGAAMLVTLSPGPDILTVITRSVTQGRRAGLVATLGFASGLVFHTTAAAVGLAVLMRQSPRALRVVKWAGAAYLLYLAVRMVLAKDAALRAEGDGQRGRLWQIYGQSVLMNVLNPKVTLFFFVFLSGFAEPGAAMPVGWQMVVYGGLFALCTVVGFGACALAAGTVAGFLRRTPGSGKWGRWGTAVVFVGLAVWLVVGE